MHHFDAGCILQQNHDPAAVLSHDNNCFLYLLAMPF